jgi:hypothetical protein
MRERGLTIGGGTANDALSALVLIGLGADFADSDSPAAVLAAGAVAGPVA